LFEDEQYELSLEYARLLAKHQPLDPNGPYWIGNNLENMGRCDEARKHYREALKIADKTFRKILHTHLGTCAYINKRFTRAYDHFSEGLNPYTGVAAPEDLYQYAFSAGVAGEVDQAIRLLDILLLKTKSEDSELREEAISLRAELKSEDFTDLGVGSWLRSLWK
jgi:tetratricopeptide (TPR) repeat protein